MSQVSLDLVVGASEDETLKSFEKRTQNLVNKKLKKAASGSAASAPGDVAASVAGALKAEFPHVFQKQTQAGRTLQRRESKAMEGTVRTTARSVTTSWQRFSASLAGNTVIIPTNALKPIRLQLEIHQLLDSKRSRPKAKAKAKVKAGKARRPEGARMILKKF